VDVVEAIALITEKPCEPGRNIECPFAADRHEGGVDSKPSMSIREEDGAAFCHACGYQSSSFIGLVQDVRDIPYPEALRQLWGELIEPLVPEDEIKDAHEELVRNHLVLLQLRQRRGINSRTVRRFQLGWRRDRLWIPIRNEHGLCVDVRRHDALGWAEGPKVLSYRRGFGGARLFPLESLESDEVVLVEGETDAMLACQMGQAAATLTSGARTSLGRLAKKFAGKRAAVVPDNDTAGRAGAGRRASEIEAAGGDAAVVRLPVKEAGEDLTDWVLTYGGTRKKLEQLLSTYFSSPPSTNSRVRQEGKANQRNGELPAALLSVAEPQSFFSGRALVIPRLGEYIRSEGHVCLGPGRQLHRWRDGVYVPDGEAFVRNRARDLLGEQYKRSLVEEVVAWFHADLESKSRIPDGHFLNVRNGLLEWRKGELHDHTPDHFSVNQLPVAWDSEPTCPKTDRFLTQVLPEDAIDFIWEILGYALYPGNPMRKAVLLLGPGANGKSVLLGVTRRLLGKENVSSVPLQSLSDNRFASALLQGRLANICGDLDAHAVKRTDTFKMITGGDAIIGEHKYGQLFDFECDALPLFSANEPPISSDQSEGWFDRWLVVPMEKRIPRNKQDKGLLGRLTAPDELEGVLVRAVEGLQRLMERDYFEPPESVGAAGDRYRVRLDSVRAFIDEECEFDPDAWTKRTRLYGMYKLSCELTGRFPLGAANFYDRLRNSYGEKVGERARKGVHGFKGIKLRR
jgi:P4 family phage/plasmid primase-like protien